MRPFDESELIAYHLHELPPQQEQELRQALHNDPTLAAESVSIESMLAEYKNHTPINVDAHALDRSWHAVRHALPRIPVAPSPLFRWRLPIFAGAGFAVAVPIFLAVHHPIDPALQQQNPSASIADATVPASTSPTISEEQRVVTLAPSSRVFHASERVMTPARSVSRTAISTEPGLSLQPDTTKLRASAEPVSGPPLPITSLEPSAVASASQSSSSSMSMATTPTQKAKATRNGARHATETDLTLSIGGTFIGTRGKIENGFNKAEGANHSVATIGSLHQQFRPLVGYRVAISYTRPDFRYNSSTSTSTTSSQYIYSSVYELAGTYVVRGPHHGRLSTYAEAGAGMMAFLPRFTDTGNDYNISPAGIVGVSAEVPVSKHFGVRAAYRAQVFKGPDFHASPAIYPLANSAILISQEPSVGITYRFTQKQQ